MGEQTKHLGDEIANTEGADHHHGRRRDHRPAPGERGAGQRGRRGAPRPHPGGAPRRHRRAPQPAARHACGGAVTTSRVELGYPDYKELYSARSGASTTTTCAPSSRGSSPTPTSLYERVMDRLVRERLGVTLAELTFADLPYLWRADGLRPRLHRRRAWCPSLRRTLAGMGIDLDAQPNVHLDTEVRELKSPRAFCAPVRVPDEIYLVVLPHGGQDDYGALLHEAGHTEHFAHVAPGPRLRVPPPGRQRRHRGLRLHLRPPLLNRRWLAEHPGVRRTATTTCASPPSTTCTSCAATPPSWPTRPSCTRRRARSTAMPAEYSRRLSDATKVDGAASRTTSSTSTTASTAPATCAPGCSRAPCA